MAPGDAAGAEPVERVTRDKGVGRVRPRKPKAKVRVAPGGASACHGDPDRDLGHGVGGLEKGRAKMLTQGGAGSGGTLGIEGASRVPPPRFPPWIVEGEVPRFEGGSPENVAAMAARARTGDPIVMSRCPFAAKLATKWGIDYLSASFPDRRPLSGGEGSGDVDNFHVLCSMDKRNRFFSIDPVKNIHGSAYHIREPENVALGDIQTFSDFAKCSRSWTDKHVTLRKTLMRRTLAPSQGEARHGRDDANGKHAGVKDANGSGDAASSSSSWSLREHVAAAMNPRHAMSVTPDLRSSQVERDLLQRVDWSWLYAFLADQGFGSGTELTLRCGAMNALVPCRYSDTDQMTFQVKGKRRMLLINPKHAFQGLYPYPVHHPYDKFSMVDFDDAGDADADGEPDRKQLWPKFEESVRGLEVILRPGDALYIPQYYFVHAQDLDAEVVSLDLDVCKGKRERNQDVVPLQISRLLEERVVQLEGVRQCHHWLSVMAHGEESEWIDTSTVKGHHRIKLVEAVYEEVELNLGKGAVPSCLGSICDRRLQPTPWLNKDFRDPLYLSDKPFYHQDDRTELEKKYPEFFRSKLASEGWNVPANVSTVPIPGYNMPSGEDYRTFDGGSAGASKT